MVPIEARKTDEQLQTDIHMPNLGVISSHPEKNLAKFSITLVYCASQLAMTWWQLLGQEKGWLYLQFGG